jgi:hypothetical protein
MIFGKIEEANHADRILATALIEVHCLNRNKIVGNSFSLSPNILLVTSDTVQVAPSDQSSEGKNRLYS